MATCTPDRIEPWTFTFSHIDRCVLLSSGETDIFRRLDELRLAKGLSELCVYACRTSPVRLNCTAQNQGLVTWLIDAVTKLTEDYDQFSEVIAYRSITRT